MKKGLFVVFWIVILAAEIFGLIKLTEYIRNRGEITQYQLQSIMDRSVAFERDGNLSLREAVKAKLAKSPTLTYGDYKQLDAFADKIETKAMIEIFNKDLYKYRSRGGLSVDLPEGYIEKKENK